MRNPDNLPTDEERRQLQSYQQDFDAGNELNPVVNHADGNTSFYAPIYVAPLRQKCHGELGGELVEEDYNTILNLYPSDRAINYYAGDLRGMWSISIYDPTATK